MIERFGLAIRAAIGNLMNLALASFICGVAIGLMARDQLRGHFLAAKVRRVFRRFGPAALRPADCDWNRDHGLAPRQVG